jgi:hypothetical protein
MHTTPSARELRSDVLATRLAQHGANARFSCDELEEILRPMRLDELRPDDYVRDARGTCWVPAPDGRLLDLLARQALPDEPSPRVLALLELDHGRGAPLPYMASQLLGRQVGSSPGLEGAAPWALSWSSRRALLVVHTLAAVRARSAFHHALTAKHFLAIVRLGGATAYDLNLRKHAWDEALCAVEALLPAALLTDDGPDANLRALLNDLERTAQECDAKQRWPASPAAAAAAGIPGPVVDGGAPKRRAQGATVAGGRSFATAAKKAMDAAAEEELRYGRWSEHTLAAIAAYAS